MAGLLELEEERRRNLALANPRSIAGLLGAVGENPNARMMSMAQDYARNLPQQLATNQQAMQSAIGGWNKTDFATGQPNPNYYPEAISELTQLMPNIGALTAWHGTPHNIQGKFDISKVGTGEGAQAYGHGMYFAEAPSVAESYKSKLSGGLGSPSNELIVNGQPLTNLSDAQRRAYEIVARDGRKNALGTAKDLEAEGFDASHIREALKATKGKEISLTKNEGNLYKVDIPDEYIPNMLDWDKPLSEQPKAVQKAFQSIMQKEVNPEGMDIGGAKILDNRNRQADPTQAQPWVMKSGDKMFGLSQKDIDQLISNETAKGLYGKLAADLGSQKAASEYLHSQGVKGIRYLDAGSRGKSGTSNFVVFDPSTVKILEKNNMPIEGLLD